ncbi:MAG TPA: hypothetical protein VNW92_24115, partial [Polyangiaceae bacterium]|nr:hypothetical protein [Polyangiaceae bacterium]
ACLPLIVDTKRSFPASFRLSWVWTKREKLRILRVILLLGALFLLSLFVRKHPVAKSLAFSVITAVSGLVLAHVYLNLARRHGSPALASDDSFSSSGAPRSG